jgi:hypothetical protein
MAYMFVHDGLVHRRFPVGPIENVPYFRRVAAAHQVKILPATRTTTPRQLPLGQVTCRRSEDLLFDDAYCHLEVAGDMSSLR